VKGSTYPVDIWTKEPAAMPMTNAQKFVPFGVPPTVEPLADVP
jgi:hypothetical protein